MTEPRRNAGSPLVRAVLTAEVPDVVALHRRARSTCSPDGLPDDGTDRRARRHAAVERPDGRVPGAVRGARRVGIASFRTPEGGSARTVELFRFRVGPGHRCSGVGTALHAACVREWRADGRREAVLGAHAGDHRAQAFSARQSWSPDPRHPPAEDGHHLRLRCAGPGE